MAAVFVEENDWEGETWRFYLTVEGNEAALDKLADLIVESPEFYFAPDIPDEAAAHICHYVTDSGYLNFHNDWLNCDLDISSLTCDNVSDVLGKGGIKDLLTPRVAVR